MLTYCLIGNNETKRTRFDTPDQGEIRTLLPIGAQCIQYSRLRRNIDITPE